MNEAFPMPINKPKHPQPSTKATLNESLALLSAHRQEWVDLSIEERITILEQVRKDFRNVWDRWAEYSVAAKGIAERQMGNDREWLEIGTINRMHTLFLRSLQDIRDGRKPKTAGGFRQLPNGQVAARIYPHNLAHALVLRNINIDVWMEPGVSLDEACSLQASQYDEANRQGNVALVLAAGNASSLTYSDTFHKLFNDLRVVLLKMNPVNSYLGSLMEESCRALIDRGFLRIVYGGAEEGDALVHHNLVDEIHLTGSDRTFDAIVFGSGEEGKKRKASGTRLVTKPVEGELGCITPWIIVPGKWSQKQVEHQAARMAFWILYNEGYICSAPRLLVLHQAWPQRQAFMDALVEALSKVTTVPAYYPGSADTQKAFVNAHPEALEIGGKQNGHIPWTVIPDLDPTAKDDICFQRESFSGLCGEVTLEATSISKFLDQAVDLLNDKVWGTLAATIIVDEKNLNDPESNSAVERAIENLHYGTVALNVSAGLGFASMIAPWGGYPGSATEDIQSGNCRVTNPLMLYRPQKTVVRAPFRWWPYPFLGTAKNLHVFSRKFAEFETDYAFRRLPGLLWSAIRT